MTRFAFVTHLLDTRLFRRRFRFLGAEYLSKGAIKGIIRVCPSFRVMNFCVKSKQSGAKTEGVGILCPFLPEHFVMLRNSEVLGKIAGAVRLGERLGAKLVGLGGLTSVIGDEGIEIARQVTAAITSGNSYTAWLAVAGIRRAAEQVGLRILESRIAIIGATGDIGSICARILSKEAREIVLSARNEERLEILSRELRQQARGEIKISRQVSEAVKRADVVLCVASSITTIIEDIDLKEGAIVCDVGYPANVAKDLRKRRKDVLVFEGGLATWDGIETFADWFTLSWFCPSRAVHGCLAETVLLSLEENAVGFSQGRGCITEEKVQIISAMAEKHGFSLAPLQYDGVAYSDAQISYVRKERARGRSHNRVFLASS